MNAYTDDSPFSIDLVGAVSSGAFVPRFFDVTASTGFTPSLFHPEDESDTMD